jgi:hypothetical protein
LNVTVVEGEGAINNIKQRTARETITEIETDAVFIDLGGGALLVCDLNDDGSIDTSSCDVETPEIVYET